MKNITTPATVAPTPSPEPTAAHPRSRLLNDILELNPTSDLSYLNSFSDEDLTHYRDHLMHGQQPRTDARPWVRRGQGRAVSFRDSDI